MDAGCRRITCWYVSEVDSSGRRMNITQEVAEEFDVEWVSMVDAPSKCSFLGDKIIVQKALEAVTREEVES